MLALAFVLALTAQPPLDTGPRRSDPASAPTPAVKSTTRRGDEVVCHPSAGTGRIQGPSVCRTRDEWEGMVRNATSGLGRGSDRSCRPGTMMGC